MREHALVDKDNDAARLIDYIRRGRGHVQRWKVRVIAVFVEDPITRCVSP